MDEGDGGSWWGRWLEKNPRTVRSLENAISPVAAEWSSSRSLEDMAGKNPACPRADWPRGRKGMAKRRKERDGKEERERQASAKCIVRILASRREYFSLSRGTSFLKARFTGRDYSYKGECIVHRGVQPYPSGVALPPGV